LIARYEALRREDVVESSRERERERERERGERLDWEEMRDY
jgi:hypothetical protein